MRTSERLCRVNRISSRLPRASALIWRTLEIEGRVYARSTLDDGNLKAFGSTLLRFCNRELQLSRLEGTRIPIYFCASSKLRKFFRPVVAWFGNRRRLAERTVGRAGAQWCRQWLHIVKLVTDRCCLMEMLWDNGDGIREAGTSE